MGQVFDYGLVLIGFILLATLAALLGRRFGSRAKGGVMLAAILLGFGAVVDPPQKHVVEAAEPPKGSPENDEPVADEGWGGR